MADDEPRLSDMTRAGKMLDLWCTKDLDFDENGCLQIKNYYLGLALDRYFHSKIGKKCSVWMYDPNAPGQKINVQCC